MTTMRHYIYNVSAAALLCLLALLPTACTQDEAATGQATMSVTFRARTSTQNNTSAGAEALEPYEHMKTLRIIVVRKSGDVLFNVFDDNIGDEVTQRTYTFPEMTVNADGEAFDFYCVANEASLTIAPEAGWANVKTVSEFKDLAINSGMLTDLNDADSKKYVPQTKYQEITVRPQAGGGLQQETIQLEFAVAKARVRIVNESTTLQTVSNLQLKAVNMTSTPLFAATPLSDESGGTLELGDITVPAAEGTAPGSSDIHYAYFYESDLASGAAKYVLSGTWLDKEHAIDLSTLSPAITSIPRGKALDITITLKADITPQINVQVDAWETHEMDVPAFE